MKRIMLRVAYDGTNYCGWQLQPNGVTIEEMLNRHLTALLKEPIQVTGASRTDSGVHSLGNVAVFDTETRIPPEKLSFALNQRLPEDIRVQESKEVPLTFHPRKVNSRKSYEYRIWNHRFAQPLCRLYSYFVFTPLDVERMQEAAAYLVGEHDFQSFCSSGAQVEDTVRTIYELSVTKEGNMITIRVTGSGFLYNMVRIIAGTLIRVGQGMYNPSYVKEILDSRDRTKAGQTAPAEGLTMAGLEYEEGLADFVDVDNANWSYVLWQKELGSTGRGYLLLRDCREEELSRTIVRLHKKLSRDGAREVLLADCRERLQDGRRFGGLVLQQAETEEALTKEIFAAAFPEEKKPQKTLKKQEIKWFFALDTPESV